MYTKQVSLMKALGGDEITTLHCAWSEQCSWLCRKKNVLLISGFSLLCPPQTRNRFAIVKCFPPENNMDCEKKKEERTLEEFYDGVAGVYLVM